MFGRGSTMNGTRSLGEPLGAASCSGSKKKKKQKCQEIFLRVVQSEYR